MQLQGLTSNALAGRTSSRNNFNLIKDQKYEKVKLFRAQNLNETNGDLPDWGICRDLANTALALPNCLLTGRMECASCSAPMVKSRALSTYLSCLLPSSSLLVPHSTRPSALAPTSFFVVFFSSLNAVRPRVVRPSVAAMQIRMCDSGERERGGANNDHAAKDRVFISSDHFLA